MVKYATLVDTIAVTYLKMVAVKSHVIGDNMKHVVIVNGKPLSGKTTFETECMKILSDFESNYHGSVNMVSTIDQVKYIYKLLGWDGISKTEEDRKNMSDLKQLYIRKCNGPVRDLFNMVCKNFDKDAIFFVDCRETPEIRKLEELFTAMSMVGVKFTSVYINKKDDHDYGNNSDRVSCDEYSYEYHIDNNKSLKHLHIQAENFIRDFIYKLPPFVVPNTI
jgi:hypothetical protein